MYLKESTVSSTIPVRITSVVFCEVGGKVYLKVIIASSSILLDYILWYLVNLKEKV